MPLGKMTIDYLLKRKDSRIWERNFYRAYLNFPGGINDWFAYGILVGVFIAPIVFGTLIYKIDIYTNKFYFGAISLIVIAYCYYTIYFRSIDWLTQKISEIKKKKIT